VDAYLVYSTPVSVGLGPSIVGLFGKVPTITYVQDLWPETMLNSGLIPNGATSNMVARLATSLSDWLYRRSQAIAVTSPGMKSALIRRGIDPDSIEYVPNWLDRRFTGYSSKTVHGKPKRQRSHNEPFHLVYAGNLGEAQGVDTIIDAAVALRSRTNIYFTIVGSGVLEEHLRTRVVRQRISNVQFLGRREIGEVSELIRTADAQIVSLSSQQLFEMTIPSKLQFSLAMGVPIIASVGGDAATIANESGGSIVTQPGSGEDMARGILWLTSLDDEIRRDMGSRARRYFEMNFSEDEGAGRMESLIRSTIRKERSFGSRSN